MQNREYKNREHEQNCNLNGEKKKLQPQLQQSKLRRDS